MCVCVCACVRVYVSVSPLAFIPDCVCLCVCVCVCVCVCIHVLIQTRTCITANGGCSYQHAVFYLTFGVSIAPGMSYTTALIYTHHHCVPRRYKGLMLLSNSMESAADEIFIKWASVGQSFGNGSTKVTFKPELCSP